MNLPKPMPVWKSTEATDIPAKVMEEKAQASLFKAVADCPNGMITMSKDLDNIVETSTNLSIVKAEKGKIELASLQRSLTEEGKNKIAADVRASHEAAGLKAESSGDYPGWKPDPDSAILKEMKEIYNNKFGKVPEVKVIHAGLECGLLGSVYTNWDMISFGPYHPLASLTGRKSEYCYGTEILGFSAGNAERSS